MRRTSRQLSERVQIWRNTVTTDGFGGTHKSDTFVRFGWANIRTESSGDDSRLAGKLTQNKEALAIMRYDENLPLSSKDYFLIVRGKRFEIISEPETEDLREAWVKFKIKEYKAAT